MTQNYLETWGIFNVFKCLQRQEYFAGRTNVTAYSAWLRDLKTHFYKLYVYSI